MHSKNNWIRPTLVIFLTFFWKKNTMTGSSENFLSPDSNGQGFYLFTIFVFHMFESIKTVSLPFNFLRNSKKLKKNCLGVKSSFLFWNCFSHDKLISYQNVTSLSDFWVYLMYRILNWNQSSITIISFYLCMTCYNWTWKLEWKQVIWQLC